MLSKIFALALGATVASASSVITVGLSPDSNPAPTVSSLVSHLEAREASAESAGLSKLQSAYSQALASAQAQISAAIGKSSFLGAKSDSVVIKVLSGPGISNANLQKIAHLAASRGSSEDAEIAAAAHDFDAITKVIVQELRAALSGKSSFVDVKVKAGSIPFPTVEDLVRQMEARRDGSEASVRSRVLSTQIQFARALNGMIAKALGK